MIPISFCTSALNDSCSPLSCANKTCLFFIETVLLFKLFVKLIFATQGLYDIK